MFESSGRRATLLLALPTAAIAALFALQALALSQERLDYPIVDDWRYYQGSAAMPLAFSPSWLFAPAQDTVHVTGKLADWLVFRGLGHDYSVLAFASFLLCFGGWLLCSLLAAFVMSRDDPLRLFACLLAFAVPLASAPYWVTTSRFQWLEPAIAYHQMLGVVGLSALALLCASREREARLRDQLAAASLTLVFGLSYSSAAAALFVFGASLVALGWLGSRDSSESARMFRRMGSAVLAPAAACLLLHILGPVGSLGINPVTEARDHSLTLPSDPLFWRFLVALFDRAALSTTTGAASWLRGALLLGFVCAPPLALSWLIWKERLEGRKYRAACVIVALSLAVVAYALLVAYGRASFGLYYFPMKLDAGLRAEYYAKARFFYWWISALLPMSVLGWGLLLEQFFSLRTTRIGVLLCAVLLLLPKELPSTESGAYSRNWDFAALYARDARQLSELIERDRLRARGEVGPNQAWFGIPKDQRNPQYKRYGPWESFAVRRPQYIRARRVGATYVDRFGLLAPRQQPE